MAFVYRLMKEKETAEGAEPPRVMALDDYFTTEGKVSHRSRWGAEGAEPP